ncbi:MAG: metallophosphoesterase [Myxococcales bacterium]|nr:metallophosphoesterase [Myxococcales bacterium]
MNPTLQFEPAPNTSRAPREAVETLVLSDMHLSDAEELDPARPHWKAYKRAEFFVDDDVSNLLDWANERSQGPMELVLNGDIFDFDNITAVPDEPPADVNWLGEVRGLASESWMSVYKIERIIADHPVFFDALGRWVKHGHALVFVMGNHDLELHWPDVQHRILAAIGVGTEEQVRFCDWFYVSESDTFISHGHQYDPYCSARSPIDPLISVHGRPRVQIPFGNLAERYMLNGMGYFNHHATSNYIMSLKEYVRFFVKYMLRTQPLLLWTWFWGAMVTLFVTLRDYLRPSMRDPMLVEDKVAGVAARARVTPRVVRQLNALSVPSAATDPMKVVRELWLDRGVLLLVMIWAAFQAVSYVNWVLPISPLWVLLPLALLTPVFLMYSFKVKPQVFEAPLVNQKRSELIAKITGAHNCVMGHTHIPELRRIGPLTFANCGFWSPAFAEPECLTRIGTQTFVWLRPDVVDPAGARRVELWEWPPGGDAARSFAPRPSSGVFEPVQVAG